MDVAIKRGSGMKVGGLVFLAALLALGATAAVFLYVNSVRQQVHQSSTLVPVIVAKQDVPAGTRLDDVIATGGLTQLSVPQNALVRDAVTDLNQLAGRVTSAPIVQGEQITTARIQGVPSSVDPLGIGSGRQAVTLNLETPQAAGGLLRRGDHVTIYAALKPDDGGPVTVTLVPDVRVLRVTPASDSGYLVTMSLTPLDGQRTIFAQSEGSVWLALLPPNQHGTSSRPTTYGGVAR